MSRTDDVINVAGHRLDTGRLEESVNLHSEIVENAVVGYNDYQKGQIPIALCVLKQGKEYTAEDHQLIANQINAKVRKEVGAFARLEGVFIIEKIPKTRSGKLLRRIVRHILNDEPYKFPSTIDDATTLKNIE